ncbi:metallophosphoesterase [Halosimplex carlsbadense 2-9-1]|uniref:DNA double-strand break repair protein Mre11 n=1 Tax=Halosimplex carlsbadense 2-9-1 TaxID=797114 RepID=M0CP71_9EURY|nr:DNA double-strand break repair protein Mre11 [Halosimplex carlsbadense]ELZ25016.1 metallophosphoesterase [Halosimplex carlsbadense 2-9-1]
MTRVIHTGDTHLGYRQYHRPERKRDYLDAFRQVADDAVTEDVDAVVHAGDLFHDRRPTLDDIMGALSVLRTLDDAGVPFLAVVGNHEAKREGQWLDLFESLGLATRLGSEPVEVGSTAFYGLDFVPRSKREGFELDLEPHDSDHAALVTHGLFEPFDFGEWDPRDIFATTDVEFAALLLGDNHHAETAQVDDTWVTYCGSTERTSAAERDERGYNVVEFNGEVDVRRRGLDTREFVFVDLELGEGEGVERVRQRVGEYDLDDAVVVVAVDGEGEPVTPAAVEEFALDRGALVARVTDRRETAEEGEREVSFGDPDDAVRERVRDLGLSDAARSLDETVRASKVADSNVDDVVQDQVADLVEDGDPAQFESVDPGEGEATDGEANAADGESNATDGESNTTDDGGSEAVEADGDGAVAGNAAADGGDPADEPDADDPGADGGEGPDTGEDGASPEDGDGQATWGEYQ